VQHAAAWSNRRMASRRLGRRQGHVLEFERHHIDVACEPLDDLKLIVIGLDCQIGDLRRRRVPLGAQHVDSIAHPLGRESQHPPELPGTEHADRSARKNGCKRLGGRDRFVCVSHGVIVRRGNDR